MFEANVSSGELKRAGKPKEIVDLVAEIGKTFTYDKYDRSGPGWESARFMIWREEQRAMADVATYQEADGTASLVRYTTFVDRLSGGSSTWFGTFVGDMETGDKSTSNRMREVEQLLGRLVKQLDAPAVCS